MSKDSSPMKIVILLFKLPFYPVIKKYKVVLSRNSYCNTISQYSFISFAGTLTFKIETFCLINNVQLVKHLLL